MSLPHTFSFDPSDWSSVLREFLATVSLDDESDETPSQESLASEADFQRDLQSLRDADDPIEDAPRAQAQTLFERYIAPLSARDPAKSSRFELLLDCSCVNANFPLMVAPGSVDPLSGLSSPTQRPAEFVLSQFFASRAHPSWSKLAQRLAADSDFRQSFERPLLFTPSSMLDRAGAPPLMRRMDSIPAFAVTYLRQHLPLLPFSRQPIAQELIRALELRMSPVAREARGAEEFRLACFGSLVRSQAEFLNARAQALLPIAPPVRQRPRFSR